MKSQVYHNFIVFLIPVFRWLFEKILAARREIKRARDGNSPHCHLVFSRKLFIFQWCAKNFPSLFLFTVRPFLKRCLKSHCWITICICFPVVWRTERHSSKDWCWCQEGGNGMNNFEIPLCMYVLQKTRWKSFRSFRCAFQISMKEILD
jgi:hypothetical protein